MSAYTAITADYIFGLFTAGQTKRYLLLKNGIIEDILDAPPSNLSTSVLNFSGFYLAPFFCDHHLHFPERALADHDKITEALLREGIRKVYDGGDEHLTGTRMKELLKDRLEIKTAGCAIYKKGTYGKFIGRAVEDFPQARRLIDELCGLGVDYIKVINSGVFKPETAGVTSGGFERPELARIISHAKERGLDVYCHANGDKRIQDAVCSGVSAVIHGLHISAQTLSMMAQMNIAFIPTVNAFAGLSALTTDMSVRANIERVVEGHLLVVKNAAGMGVRVLPGTDSGPQFIPYGKAYSEELVLFKKAGLTDEYIISSAVAGPFVPGMKADFLVLKGTKIEKIFLGGECLDNVP